MATAEYPLEIEQGATFVRNVFVLISDGETAYDLTDCAIEGSIRRFYNSCGTADATFTVTFGTRVDGEFTISISSQDLALLSNRQTYYYDLLMTTAAGNRYRILQGASIITGRVTITADESDDGAITDEIFDNNETITIILGEGVTSTPGGGGGGGSGGNGIYDEDVTSWAELAAIDTFGSNADAEEGDVKQFIVSGSLKTVRLEASTAATNVPFSQRPDDYSTGTHEFVWINVG